MTVIQYIPEAADLSVYAGWHAGTKALQQLLLCTIGPLLCLGAAAVWSRLLLNWPSVTVVLAVVYFSLAMVLAARWLTVKPRVLGPALRLLMSRRVKAVLSEVDAVAAGPVKVSVLPRGISVASAGGTLFIQWDQVAPLEGTLRGYVITTQRSPARMIVFIPRRAFLTPQDFDAFAMECAALKGEFKSANSAAGAGIPLNRRAPAMDAAIGVVLTTLIFLSWWLFLVLLGNFS